jgi:hypothetical protein
LKGKRFMLSTRLGLPPKKILHHESTKTGKHEKDAHRPFASLSRDTEHTEKALKIYIGFMNW